MLTKLCFKIKKYILAIVGKMTIKPLFIVYFNEPNQKKKKRNAKEIWNIGKTC